jgi:hypothetical protein
LAEIRKQYPAYTGFEYSWSLQRFGETLISRTRFGLFVINKSIHVADVWVIRVGSHTTFSKFRREKPEFHTSEIEILWLEVIINNLKAMVGVIYRPPHSDVSYWQKFENNIQPILGCMGNTCWLPHNILQV